MKYGYFDDQAREYVITDPQTPYPWINYSGARDFFSIISNTAGGYCFYRDARLRRLTRYRYNSVPIDEGGRYFYIRENSNGGDFWSPGWAPVRRGLDRYECRHGLGYTRITGARNNITAELLVFVPLDFNGEVQKVSLTNTGRIKKDITLFSFVEFCLWNAYDDMTNFQRNFNTGEVEYENNTIYHKTEYRERRNHFAFYSVNADVTGFDTNRNSFVGMYGDFSAPRAVLSGKSSDSIADGWSPVASHSINIELKPGEKREFVFILGYVENPQEEKWLKPGVINKKNAYLMKERFAASAGVDAAFGDLREYWSLLLSRYNVQSGDERLNRMVNIWNQYQCMVTFNLSRSASGFESGIGRGMGFRDSNQDVLGFVHQIPGRARERILDLAATQLEDGGAYHQYQPLTKKGNNEIGGNFNDDPLWLILATAAYMKETGDFGILGENVPFDGDPAKAAALLEHLRRSFRRVLDNLGPHGLPLIGRADWNDCLNLNCFSLTPDESFQTTTNKEGATAESVLIAAMFVYIGLEYARICEIAGKPEEAEDARRQIERMKDAVMKYGYDGEWFLRAYDDSGNKVGSRENEEGRIFIETQGFCVMAGIGLDRGDRPGDGSVQPGLGDGLRPGDSSTQSAPNSGDSSTQSTPAVNSGDSSSLLGPAIKALDFAGSGDSSRLSGSGDSSAQSAPAMKALDSAWKYLDTPHDIDPGDSSRLSGSGDSSAQSAPAMKALDSAWKYLDTPHGMVLLNPAYTKYHPELGEITSYPPGYKENAGIFCHNNPWIMIAETVVGRGGKAFECYSKIAPAYREEISDLHRMEPYVYSQMIAGKDASRHGEAKNSWLTGTAAWNFTAVSQWILGVRPDFDGLVIDPCIPEGWQGFKVRRYFRGAYFDIEVRNPRHVSKGVSKLIVDGKELAGNLIPVAEDNANHKVEVIMG